MKVLNIDSRNDIVGESFREVSKLIKGDGFKNQISQILNNMKIQETFRENLKDNLSSDENWLNIIDFLKYYLKKYDSAKNKKIIQEEIAKALNDYSYSFFGNKGFSPKNNNISNIDYYLSDLNRMTISYDIKEKRLVLLLTDKRFKSYDKINVIYQRDNNGNINKNALCLFKFDYFDCATFYHLYNDLDDELYFNILKYAIGLENSDKLVSFIVSNIRKYLTTVFNLWAEESLKSNIDFIRLDIFPHSFYREMGILI